MAIIRIKNGFGDRNGLNVVDRTIQTSTISEFSRIAIKNKVIEIFARWRKNSYHPEAQKQEIVTMFSKDVFCLPLDSDDANYYSITQMIFETIMMNEYFDVFSLIEYICKEISFGEVNGYGTIHNTDFRHEFNKLFEEECIGYRFVGEYIEPITNSNELAEISLAIETPFEEKVNSHIKKALSFLAVTGKKDYENCIKESVLGLEGLCALITKKDGTLSSNIKIISKDKKLHPSFEEMILKLYGYSSDEGGIRHENKKKGFGTSFDEAKYILVLSSSTINYLVGIYSLK